jgi:hypothetical protein
MNFISAEEFLKQSEKVQKILMDWWTPSWSDLVLDENQEYRLADSKYGVIEKEKCIPLFTEGQLRKFIEEKLNSKLNLIDSAGFYNVQIGFENDRYYDTKCKDALEAYWQVTIKIAEEG